MLKAFVVNGRQFDLSRPHYRNSDLFFKQMMVKFETNWDKEFAQNHDKYLQLRGNCGGHICDDAFVVCSSCTRVSHRECFMENCDVCYSCYRKLVGKYAGMQEIVPFSHPALELTAPLELPATFDCFSLPPPPPEVNFDIIELEELEPPKKRSKHNEAKAKDFNAMFNYKQ